MKPVWLIWWSCLLSCGHSSPGVVMRVTQKWMDYIVSEGKDVFRHMLQHNRLPDVIGSTRVFGKVDYAITGITVEEFDPSHAVVVPTPPTDVLLNVEGSLATVFGQWRVKHWLITDNGNFTLRISGVTLNSHFKTLKDSSTRPSVSLSSCHSEVKHAKVHLSGGASWFYNLFTGFLEKPIRDNLNEKLCPQVGEVMTILQKKLATFLVSADLDAHTKIDYSLINPPRVQKTNIDLDLKGTIHRSGAQEPQEAYVPPIILPDTQRSMIFMGFSEYFFNALGKTYFMSDILKLTLTQEQYPQVFWLRTGDYSPVIPEIKKYYPQSEAVVLTVTAFKPPEIVLTSQLTMQMEGILDAHVVLPYLMMEQMFSTTVHATFIADTVHLSNLNLKVSFSIQSFRFKDFKSFVGHVDVVELEHSLGHMLRDYIVRAINSGLSSGIPIPSIDDVTYQESAVSITPGCLVLSMDMYYTPWKELMGSAPVLAS
ncbi:BPI fold-containing family C protein-like isoform X2 [Hyla sarda]|nr:BPI fold-containing family C protein-like isoform X2 [Hyla sarda]XP_056406409.1 BPI fold-containing family C protein-like isoform X2 [Hyla sarda]XP_056406410.1 BPI fold-containing family C protein-like isoform X2 [Hyla sarda]XP_056406411.1 BPI fold-containing family C protein-like isoform X2 [Hyla sarda]XP_056406412.1 BPI fold-containing family C protein-like isoform X2 [Hyla sarda]XP_056406413.1 BPI fold-containing family C protein-like isoform X2 [Hyla sarda]XP_056406414.1 BPI fold-conta